MVAMIMYYPRYFSAGNYVAGCRSKKVKIDGPIYTPFPSLHVSDLASEGTYARASRI